jgi:hypothetical protein
MSTPQPPARRYEECERDWFLILFGAGMSSDTIRKAMGDLNRNVMPSRYLEMSDAVIAGSLDRQKSWLSDHCGVKFEEGDKPLRGVFDSIVEHLAFRVMKNGHASILAAMDKGPHEYLAELEAQADRCKRLFPELADKPEEKAA